MRTYYVTPCILDRHAGDYVSSRRQALSLQRGDRGCTGWRNVSTCDVLILFICFDYKVRNNKLNSETDNLFRQSSKIPSKWYLALLLYNQFEDYNEISMFIDNFVTF